MPELLLAHESVAGLRPVPDVVGLAAQVREAAHLDRTGGRPPGHAVADVQDDEPGVPVRQEGQAVAHIHIVKEAGAAVEAGGRSRGGRVRDVQDAEAAADPVHHEIGVVPFQPRVVNAWFEAGRETADDPRMGRVGQVEERDSVAPARGRVSLLVREHAQAAVRPDLYVVDRARVHRDRVGERRHVRLVQSPCVEPVAHDPLAAAPGARVGVAAVDPEVGSVAPVDAAHPRQTKRTLSTARADRHRHAGRSHAHGAVLRHGGPGGDLDFAGRVGNETGPRRRTCRRRPASRTTPLPLPRPRRPRCPGPRPRSEPRRLGGRPRSPP